MVFVLIFMLLNSAFSFQIAVLCTYALIHTVYNLYYKIPLIIAGVCMMLSMITLIFGAENIAQIIGNFIYYFLIFGVIFCLLDLKNNRVIEDFNPMENFVTLILNREKMILIGITAVVSIFL